MKVEIIVYKASGKWYTSDVVEVENDIPYWSDEFKEFIRNHNPANIGEGFIVTNDVDSGEYTGFHNALWLYSEIYK